MPRLTDTDFLDRHHFLAELWNDALLQRVFGAFTPNEQLDLHQYYQTINGGSAAEVIETRTTVNLGDASLTQRAGRVYAKLLEYYLDAATTLGVTEIDDLAKSVPIVSAALAERRAVRAPSSSTRKRAKGAHRVQAIMKPEIDMEAFAKLLLKIVLDKQKEETDQRDAA